jgi:hypothetical protein
LFAIAPRSLTEAQVRELFTKLGVAGALLDKVVKSISSSDDTLLSFMRKVDLLVAIPSSAHSSLKKFTG